LGENRIMPIAMREKNTRKNNAPTIQSDADQSDTKMIDFMRNISHVRAKW